MFLLYFIFFLLSPLLERCILRAQVTYFSCTSSCIGARRGLGVELLNSYGQSVSSNLAMQDLFPVENWLAESAQRVHAQFSASGRGTERLNASRDKSEGAYRSGDATGVPAM